MCGIIGYIGRQNSLPILTDSLEKMEYRGYDSAGLAFLANQSIQLIKDQGTISELLPRIQKTKSHSHIGIGHTRWATHGKPSQENAHPILDANGRFAIVHNGVIENYSSLKDELIEAGYVFQSDTDTEVIVHFLDFYDKGDTKKAFLKTLERIRGTYGLLLLSKREPNRLLAARLGSPLVLGQGKEENFVASDVSALLRYVNDVIYLEDGEVLEIYANTFSIQNLKNEQIQKYFHTVDWSLEETEKNGYPSFMLKEIYEQGQSLTNTLRGRLDLVHGNAVLSSLTNLREEILSLKRIVIVGMGTSYYAGMIGKYLIEDLSRVSVELENASEFRHRSPLVDPQTLVIALSQSGETADTLGAIQEAKLKGAKVLSICNVVGSSMARESDQGVFLHVGPEIAVASTKAFSSQILSLFLIALFIGRSRTLSLEQGKNILEKLQQIPELVSQTIRDLDPKVQVISQVISSESNMLYLGRGYSYPIALEGALKMKEVSYIHAEGYNSAEIKHGPIALVDSQFLVLIFALQDGLYDKSMLAVEEVKARKGKVLAIGTEGDQQLAKKADFFLPLPKIESFLSPFLSILPLQLLAYFCASYRGYNVDRPRNLAKSVTVE